MFVVAAKRLFWWPVEVKVPHPEKAGEFQEHTFEMQFEAMSLERGREIDAARNALPADKRDAFNFDYIFELTKGWRDIVDADGEAVPFTRENLEAQLGFAWFRTGVLAAYEQAITGQAARLGN
ncbi:hypothetical protein [Methylobacterium flocculans]|uniref:hypothetical protein n=1 Tax=Methylobacterium flocculans TaxID=2984843 RepID=UPI0021F3C2D5|nr:hypothetical protein [Methylobacterium sp. FF17]